jgi:hypothetical protein
METMPLLQGYLDYIGKRTGVPDRAADALDVCSPKRNVIDSNHEIPANLRITAIV